MRRPIEALARGGAAALHHPDHPGLAHDVWQPLNPKEGGDKKAEAEVQQAWMTWLERATLPEGYPEAFRAWKATFEKDGSRALEATLASRLLLGHGNSSPTGVGLTFHHTWGVPVIPGTAVKGLVASYLFARHGPETTALHPLDPDHAEPDRAPWQGVSWNGRRIEHGPGAAYRMLFGAPRAASDRHWAAITRDELPGPVRGWVKSWEDAEALTHNDLRAMLIGERQGLVTFHDAWLDPAGGKQHIPLLVHDVLTVHQKRYYDARGVGRGAAWPTDYDDPNPVSFLTVHPGWTFLFPLSGPPAWTRLARILLQKALREWGIGGKTSAGYGRFGRCKEVVTPPDPDRDPTETAFSAWVEERTPRLRALTTTKRAVLAEIESDWLSRLQALDETARERVATRIWRMIRPGKKLKPVMQDLLHRLDAGTGP